jgi:hypothetical protein
MDRYCGFVYHVLIADLLDSPKLRRVTLGEQPTAASFSGDPEGRAHPGN